MQKRNWWWAVQRKDGTYISACASGAPTLWHYKPWISKTEQEIAIKVKVVEACPKKKKRTLKSS